MSQDYLSETPLLNFHDPAIQKLVEHRSWAKMPDYDRIGAIYDFVRNEILFGYNRTDELTASHVLADGFGQCNTKGTLLMALLRAVGVPCRFHGFTIDKKLQRGVVPERVYPLAPKSIIHSWVEISFQGKWLNLEGFILDQPVLTALQEKFPDRASLCAYGAGTDCLQNPQVTWRGESTYIQKTGINHDYGIFSSPDDFYARHRQLTGFKGVLYRRFVRHWMNWRVAAIRKGHIPNIPGIGKDYESVSGQT